MSDDLRTRHPGLMIDNCASGGRRIDIETCSRSIPLWHSDMQCEGPRPADDQLQNGGLTRWVPLHGCGNFGLEPSYVFRSGMTAGNVVIPGFSDDELENIDSQKVAAVKKTVSLYKELRPLFTGDFYPLLPHDESESQWYGYQLDNPEQEAGFALFFRRAESTEDTKTILIGGVDPNASYEVTNTDSGATTQIFGKELKEKGLVVKIDSPSGTSLIRYRKAIPKK
jgi:alpha-galactosidase